MAPRPRSAAEEGGSGANSRAYTECVRHDRRDIWRDPAGSVGKEEAETRQGAYHAGGRPARDDPVAAVVGRGEFVAGGPVRIRVSPEGFCRLKKRSKGDSARDRRLIEEWLPIAELSVEGPRERTPMTPFPAPNRLHVWWARRPLVASRAAVLGSLLPAGADREKFLHLLGIHGDPVAVRQAIDRAKQSGKRIKNPYDYDRAFKYCPTHEERRWLEQNGMRNWRSIRVLDPTAGGGAIPFETHRSGLVTLGNDLNPVAALIADATVTWPAQFPRELADEFEALASDWRQRIPLCQWPSYTEAEND